MVEFPASVLIHPAIVVATRTVIFEKLLLLLLVTLPATDVAALVKSVTVPPAAVLLKDVTIELLLTFCVPVAERITLLEMKVTLVLVLILRFVNRLLLIAWDKVAAVFEMYVLTPIPITEYVIPWKLLLLIDNADVPAPAVLFIKICIPEFAAVNVKAPVVEFPILFELIFIAVVTAPEL